MIPLELESGEFIFTPYSLYRAFICRGDLDFLERAYNLINNFGNETKKFYKFDEQTRYFVLPKEEVLKRVSLYYRWVVAANNNYTEEELDLLSFQKASLFWDNNVTKVAFFAKNHIYSPAPYNLGYINFKYRYHKIK